MKTGQDKREADPPRPRAGQAAAMARPDPPRPRACQAAAMACPDPPVTSLSSTSDPNTGSTSGSISTTTHWQPLPWKVLCVLASTLPKTSLLRCHGQSKIYGAGQLLDIVLS